MKRKSVGLQMKRAVLCLALLGLAAGVPDVSNAQVNPPQRVIRTYIPPDQLVSFLPSTPFSQFVEFLNPIFDRVTGKQIVDPESQNVPIDIAISGMHFLDAFELVLEYNGLTYRETEDYFIVETAEAPQDIVTGSGAVVAAGESGASAELLPVTAGTREVEINAVLFDLNHTRARELGLNWNVLFGEEVELSPGGSGTEFVLRTDRFFEDIDDIIGAPTEISFSKVTQFFRALENEGVGETVANPQVTVMSGEKGRIQIGSDVPVQTRDFAGNTLTQFFSTGIIVDVTPTVIAASPDDTSAVPVDFIHLDVLVEKSSSRPSPSGPIIDRNNANTQVLLLDGEQTIIGGLYSTEEIVSRRGIPILKDLPGWFFGLRYLFGFNTKTVVQKELLIVLQARMLDSLQARAQRPYDRDLIEQHRTSVIENVRRVDENAALEVRFPDAP